jgi:hypothetical protein
MLLIRMIDFCNDCMCRLEPVVTLLSVSFYRWHFIDEALLALQVHCQSSIHSVDILGVVAAAF